MNITKIHEIQSIKETPSTTITIPTHRNFPEIKQDKIRIKNLTKQAADRLRKDYQKKDIEPLLSKLEHLVERIDYTNLLDGLLIFINNNYEEIVKLPFTLPERLVIGGSFFTRDLVFAMNRTIRYWVLVLSEKPTRLYEGTQADLIEITEGGFPMVHDGPGGELPLPGGFGIRRSAYRDEYHRKFFRQVDAALNKYMNEDPLPLVIVGVDRYLAFFNEVSNHKESIIASLTGNHDTTSPHELGRLVWPLVKTAKAKERQHVLIHLDNAVKERNVASGINEVWRAANAGDGHLLIVEDDYHQAVSLSADGKSVISAADSSGQEIIDDVVDEIIETVLHNQGKVIFVDPGQLATHQKIALILKHTPGGNNE